MVREALAQGRDLAWGPFVEDLAPAERLARLRVVRMLVHIFARPERQLLFELKRAELLVGQEAERLAYQAAEETFNELPALKRRKILASYGELR